MTLREEIGCGLDGLVVFRNLKEDKILHAIAQFFHTHPEDTSTQIRCYSEMVSNLYEYGDDLTSYFEDLVLQNENMYICKIGAGEKVSTLVESCMRNELKLLEKIAMLTPMDFQEQIRTDVKLPVWITHSSDFVQLYTQRAMAIGNHGYGIYAKYNTFTLDDNGELCPVKYPDPVTLDDLIGYQLERQQVIDNTKVLLAGHPAENVLLSGDAGTGKSATIKAITNAFREQGLRLIELNKDQLKFIPKLMDKLCKNPLKFILFIDDLTFQEDDPNFGKLKAILEGSIAARTNNTVIYATSNRRHLVKETFDDGSDKHKNDTIQERISLSERFGITITYSRPDKKLYLEIVDCLAQRAGLQMPTEELHLRAEQYVLQKASRSARAAKHIVNQLVNQQKESL